jgi:AraC family transcriptional regulator, arabinose operon regulatory protein
MQKHVIYNHLKRWAGKETERIALGLQNDDAALPFVVTTSGVGIWTDKRYYTRSRSAIFGLELVVSGNAAFEQNGREYSVEPGQVYILRNGARHRYGVGTSGYLIKRFVTLEGPMLSPLLHMTGLVTCDTVSAIDARRFTSLFKRIDSLLVGKPPFFAVAASAAAYELVLELGRSVHPRLPRPVQSALEFMQRNLQRQLSSADLARAAGLSPTHFNRLFGRHMRRSPMAYFNDRRMDWARYLLRSTSLSVKEVAASMGFEDPFYFSARFKKAVGKAPRESRGR